MGLGLTFFAAGSPVESEDATDPALSLLSTLEEEGVGRAVSVVDRRVLIVEVEVEAVVGMAGGGASSSEISPAHTI